MVMTKTHAHHRHRLPPHTDEDARARECLTFDGQAVRRLDMKSFVYRKFEVSGK